MEWPSSSKTNLATTSKTSEIDERPMTLTLSGQIDVTIVAAYAPTAIATAEDKDKFYNKLCTISSKYKKKGLMYSGADLNAKRLHPGDGTEGIGPNILTSPHTLREGEGVEDSRYRLQEYLIHTNTILTNTVFPKQP